MGTFGCHSCVGRTPWLPPEDLGCSPAEGGWMLYSESSSLIHKDFSRRMIFPGGCVSALTSCRCFEEQELCAWESSDCSECPPNNFLPCRLWQWHFATEFPNQANLGWFSSCQRKEELHCFRLQPGSAPAPSPALAHRHLWACSHKGISPPGCGVLLNAAFYRELAVATVQV